MSNKIKDIFLMIRLILMVLYISETTKLIRISCPLWKLHPPKDVLSLYQVSLQLLKPSDIRA